MDSGGNKDAVYLLFLPLGFFIVINPHSLLVFFLLGITEIGSIYTIMKMHSYSHLSISTIVSRTRLIWVALLSFLVVGEKLETIQYAAIALLFVGLLIITTPKELKGDKGVKYAHLSAFFAGLIAVFLKASSPYISSQGALVIMGVFPIFVFPIVMKDSKKRLLAAAKRVSFVSSMPLAANILASYLYALALSMGSASIVVAIYQGSMIFSVLGGIIFLQERHDIRKKLIGSILAFLAIILLALK